MKSAKITSGQLRSCFTDDANPQAGYQAGYTDMYEDALTKAREETEKLRAELAEVKGYHNSLKEAYDKDLREECGSLKKQLEDLQKYDRWLNEERQNILQETINNLYLEVQRGDQRSLYIRLGKGISVLSRYSRYIEEARTARVMSDSQQYLRLLGIFSNALEQNALPEETQLALMDFHTKITPELEELRSEVEGIQQELAP